MGSEGIVKVTVVGMMVCIAALGAPFVALGAFTCCEVKPTLEACGCFVKSGSGDTVPEQCCYQVIHLRDQVMNCSQSRQIACNCILDAARKVPDLNASAFEIIPQRCGVRLPFQFSINMNCSNL
ncbi:hypothetical protein VNO77_20735 [Canavalia gladiata]|uniref:Bifunctional inhibitor/plant lipid transfer protein/seed storage helical domain-containing protein n=1 Tax=Canavalia gladiata TaxID=3824 RepID=A0AAN9LUW0_CANGL